MMYSKNSLLHPTNLSPRIFYWARRVQGNFAGRSFECALCYDLRKRKDLEKVLNADDEGFELSLENLPDGLYYLSLEGREGWQVLKVIKTGCWGDCFPVSYAMKWHPIAVLLCRGFRQDFWFVSARRSRRSDYSLEQNLHCGGGL